MLANDSALGPSLVIVVVAVGGTQRSSGYRKTSGKVKLGAPRLIRLIKAGSVLSDGLGVAG